MNLQPIISVIFVNTTTYKGKCQASSSKGGSVGKMVNEYFLKIELDQIPVCDLAANAANCKRQSLSLLPLREYERDPPRPPGTCLWWGKTPRKRLSCPRIHRADPGRRCLHRAACADWSGTRLLIGWRTYGPNMDGRQQKRNGPLCLVNPKCPIGLKWFQFVVFGLRLCGEDFQLPRHLIA